MSDQATIRRALFDPGAVALVGASADSSKNTGRPQRFLAAHGFRGDVYPVNPRRDKVQGAKAFATVGDLPDGVDHAFIMVPTDAVAEAVVACGERGIPLATIYSDGFAERGAQGRDRQDALLEVAEKAGVRLLGPNSIGVICPASNLTLSVNAVLEMPEIQPGGLSLVSQSGTILGTLLSRGHARGKGFARMVSVGNEADLSIGEVVDLLVDDPQTETILLFLEAVRNRKTLAAAARRAFDAGKPVLAYKLGRSEAGRQLALSHSGAVAGPDKAISAFFQAHGIARLDMLESLFEAPGLFQKHKPASGNRVAVVTTTGGGAATVADRLGGLGCDLVPAPEFVRTALKSHGLDLGHGPLVDLTMAGTRDGVYGAALAALDAADDIDAIVCVVGSSGQFHPELAVAPIVQAGRTNKTPIAAFIVPEAPESLAMLEAASVPGFRTPEACADAVAAYLSWRAPSKDAEVKTASADLAEAQRRLETAMAPTLNEREASLVFEALGIPIAPAQVVKSPGETVELAFPVVAKLLDRTVQHKSDQGFVRLNIADMETLWDTVADFTTRAPGAEGVLIQSQSDGVGEVIVGFRQDAEAGPIILVGPGGIFTELYGDVAVRAAPVTPEQALEMMDEVAGLKPLQGYRGHTKGDLDALAQAVAAFSRLALLETPVLEAEINPLIVRAENAGVVGVDAVLITETSL